MNKNEELHERFISAFGIGAEWAARQLAEGKTLPPPDSSEFLKMAGEAAERILLEASLGELAE